MGGVSAIVLAGGKGRRLGTEKQSVVLGHRQGQPVTMLASVVERAASVSDDIIIVGGNELPLPVEVRWVRDRFTGCGPLGGLEAGLTSARWPLAIALGCDMPFVPTSLLSMLIDRAGGIDSSRPSAVVPKTSLGIEPLCAVYTRACRDVISDLITAEPNRVKRMSSLLSVVDTEFVTESDLESMGSADELFFNVNTPVDLDRAQMLWQTRYG